MKRKRRNKLLGFLFLFLSFLPASVLGQSIESRGGDTIVVLTPAELNVVNQMVAEREYLKKEKKITDQEIIGLEKVIETLKTQGQLKDTLNNRYVDLLDWKEKQYKDNLKTEKKKRIKSTTWGTGVGILVGIILGGLLWK